MTRRRAGMTMTEVLVTVFVVSIGLSGVMAMFPFGARQMQDVLVADRATSHAHATDALVRGYWKEKVVELNGNGEPFWDALDAPGGALPSLLPRKNEPSYPVFLDPMGTFRSTVASSNWVGDRGNTRVPRRSMKLVTTTGDPARVALRLFSQADGLSWDEDSQPKPGIDMRELRYNSLAVIQRPNNSDPFNATLKIVVFLNRKFQFYPTGSEAVFTSTWLPGTTQIQLSTRADIKKGSWIMDAGPTNAALKIRHANFYRVVSATESPTNPNVYDVELHTPIKRVDGLPNAYNGQAVVMAGVAEVFERPMLTGSSAPAQ
ncbi:MAG: prepilin-type N-terminal cleavage/methylation domain-containing protein [Gemmata sp.]